MAETKVDQTIIDTLNLVLTGELTAVNQYVLHAKMVQSWGYKSLYGVMWTESMDEMKHATALIDRILYLGGLPNLQRLGRLRIGENVPEMFENDLALENEAIPMLNAGIEQCVAAGDNGTRQLLDSILQSEEAHVDWLEEQQSMIARLGLQNYLTTQVGV
jgi:bacterioferritin